jgi:hypothetical protein
MDRPKMKNPNDWRVGQRVEHTYDDRRGIIIRFFANRAFDGSRGVVIRWDNDHRDSIYYTNTNSFRAEQKQDLIL